MKKIWDKKSMLNFSRQAYNEKVTDCHALFCLCRLNLRFWRSKKVLQVVQIGGS